MTAINRYRISGDTRVAQHIPDIMDVLRRNARRRNFGAVLAPALDRLRREADGWLEQEPLSVMQKQAVPPTGSKHDYLSLAIYLWPNPDTADGLPYVTRDGEVNPEVDRYDRPRMLRMQAAVEVLSLAYVLTGDDAYAAKAAALLRTWFLDEATRMNPNLLCAQYIPGGGGFKTVFPPRFVPDGAGGGIYVAFGGVIEGCTLPALLDSVELLRTSPAWSAQDHAGLQSWARAYVQWLRESQLGKDEAGCPNNHGSWYVAEVAALALFCGEEALARHVLEEDAPRRIALQIEPDGRLPQELTRTRSFHYTAFALTSFMNMALSGARLGVDLWTFETPDGRGLRRAIDWLLPYVQGRQPWTWPSIEKPNAVDAVPLLCAAGEAYRQPEYAAQIDRVHGYPADHVYRLLYPGLAV